MNSLRLLQPWRQDGDITDREDDNVEGGGVAAKSKPKEELVGAPGIVRSVGKTKNKFACYSVYRGGFKVSKMFAMVHVIRKPPKGYSLGGYIVSCFCTREGKKTGKLSDLPNVVTAHFPGEVLNVFKEHYPQLSRSGIREGTEWEEQDSWRKWCSLLRLARPVLPDGRASGKVKLIWNHKEVKGEIWKDLLEEGEEERLDVRYPVGVLWKGGLRLPVLSVSYIGYKDEEQVEGDGIRAGNLLKKEEVNVDLLPSRLLNYAGREYFFVKLIGYRGKGYELPGVTVELRSVNGIERVCSNSSPISWNGWKESGWDGGKLGKKEIGDLTAFANQFVVLRNKVNGHEDVVWVGKERAEECVKIYDAEDAVVGGKTVVMSVKGLHNHGMTGFGRGGGIEVETTLVWEGSLKTVKKQISFEYMAASGYKCGWFVEEDGKLNYTLATRHIPKLKNNLMFVFDEGNKENLRLDFTGVKLAIFKKLAYVGGYFCMVSVTFACGYLRIKCHSVVDDVTGAVIVTEDLLVMNNWLDLARQVTNATEEGLGKLTEALGWNQDGKLVLLRNDCTCEDDDVVLGHCLMKSALRIEDEICWIKCSTFTYRERRGVVGDDGLVFDIFPSNPDAADESWEEWEAGFKRKRAVLTREDLLEDYGCVILKKGIGKSLSRLPRNTLYMILGTLRQNSYGQNSD